MGGQRPYYRLNEHYREGHELAWLLLEGIGLDGLFASGPTRSCTFLIDMNQLLERLIIRLVNHALTDERYQVHVGSE